MAIIISLPEEVRHISNIANNFRDGNDVVELKESLLAIVENESSAKTADTTKSTNSAGFYTSQSTRGAESLSFCGFCSILASASVQVIVHSRLFFFHTNYVIQAFSDIPLDDRLKRLFQWMEQSGGNVLLNRSILQRSQEQIS